MVDTENNELQSSDAGQGDASGLRSSNLDAAAISRHITQSGPAPVHLWNPPYCGEMDLRIARDGTWIHEGRPIRREALVRLFSSILKKEGDRYFLVTPVEKVGIQVEDCPFVACLAEISGSGREQRITLALNTGETVDMDRDHPLVVSELPASAEPHPVIQVRNGLDALVSRNVFYQLAELAEPAEETAGGQLGVWSAGCFFSLEVGAAEGPDGGLSG